MGAHGQVVWGKSGDPVGFKIEKATKVEQVWYLALDELVERLQRIHGSDRIGGVLDRKKLVLLDHSGNQPRPEDLVSEYSCLFLFVRPGRDLPSTHPDTLSPVEAACDRLPELPPADLHRSQLGESGGAAPQQKIGEYLAALKDRCRQYSQVARERASANLEAQESIQRQLQARDAVCALITNLHQKLRESHATLHRTVRSYGTTFDDLLTNFEPDMERLRKTPLHPSLKSDDRATLKDCVHDITPYKDCCNEKWQGLLAKLSEFGQHLEKVAGKVGEISNSLPTCGVDFDAINAASAASAQARDELLAFQGDIIASLGLFKERGGGSASAAEVLDVHIRTEQALVQKLHNGDAQYKLCTATRQHVQTFMKRHIEQAVNISSEIARLHRRVKMYHATLTKLHEHFHELKIVRYMPEAYRWGLLELFRRVHYHRKVACVISTAQQTLQKFNAEEEKTRQEWLDTLGPYLPPTILEALQQPVVTVKVDTHPVAMHELTYPAFHPPYDTPEATARFYEGTHLAVPPHAPLPPPALAALHSTALDRELDELVDRLGEPRASQPPESVSTPPPAAGADASPNPAMLQLEQENAALWKQIEDLETRAAAAPTTDAAATAQARRIAELEAALERSEALRAEGEQRAANAQSHLLSGIEERSTERAQLESERNEAVARAIEAEESLRDSRVERGGYEEMEELVTRCRTVEECVRLLPGMADFALESTADIQRLRDACEGKCQAAPACSD